MAESRKLSAFTPREVVSELDRYIVGQNDAKRAVAIALRNRWRRQQVPDDLRDEIYPKNIIMIGPTGVGKTEIARRLAKLSQAPFVKVEASKFTEVGYVGRDVESMIRDLVEAAIALVREEETEKVKPRAEELAEDRLMELIKNGGQTRTPSSPPFGFSPPPTPAPAPLGDSEREKLRAQLRAGTLDDQTVEVETSESSPTFMRNFSGQGMEEIGVNLQDLFKNMPGMKNTRKRKLRVPEALQVLRAEEAQKLVDPDRVQREAVARAESSGIVFIDEIDKIASREGGKGGGGPDVSREGVQRDILPIVEGSAVNTKYGQVKTDHMLFIAAGAFHVSKPADLIPELQGRFPIRVELEPLSGEAHPARAQELAHAPVHRAARHRRRAPLLHGRRGGGNRPHRPAGQRAHAEHRRPAAAHRAGAPAGRGVVHGQRDGPARLPGGRWLCARAPGRHRPGRGLVALHPLAR